MSRSASVLPGALVLGAVAGMRSLLAPALVSRALRARPGPRPPHQPARALASPTVGRLLPVLAAGELVVDKLPITPDRTLPPSLAGRVLSGALAAAALAASQREPGAPAALLGGAAAFASAHAMLRLRKAINRRLDVPDALVGGGEDLLALGLGGAVLRGMVRA